MARDKDKAKSVAHLSDAITRFDALHMAMWAAAARRRCGELLGGAEGQNLLEAGTVFMVSMGVKNPARVTDMLAPGFALAAAGAL
jgi:hypothetical protein